MDTFAGLWYECSECGVDGLEAVGTSNTSIEQVIYNIHSCGVIVLIGVIVVVAIMGTIEVLVVLRHIFIK